MQIKELKLCDTYGYHVFTGDDAAARMPVEHGDEVWISGKWIECCLCGACQKEGFISNEIYRRPIKLGNSESDAPEYLLLQLNELVVSGDEFMGKNGSWTTANTSRSATVAEFVTAVSHGRTNAGDIIAVRRKMLPATIPAKLVLVTGRECVLCGKRTSVTFGDHHITWNGRAVHNECAANVAAAFGSLVCGEWVETAKELPIDIHHSYTAKRDEGSTTFHLDASSVTAKTYRWWLKLYPEPPDPFHDANATDCAAAYKAADLPGNTNKLAFYEGWAAAKKAVSK